MDLSKLDVTVTSGNVFTGEDSAKLALLIYRRFGDNSAWRAWLRLMENNCGRAQYMKLVRAGEILENLDELKYADLTGYDSSITYIDLVETQELLKELDNL